MKILKLLNRKYLSIFFFLCLGFTSYAEDKPVDIWNTNEEETEELSIKNDNLSDNSQNNDVKSSDIFSMQSNKEIDSVKVDTVLDSKDRNIIGLYDPEDYGLKIDMWASSNGDQLKYLFSNLDKLDLSRDAADLMNILLLTNAYFPKNKSIATLIFIIKPMILLL